MMACLEEREASTSREHFPTGINPSRLKNPEYAKRNKCFICENILLFDDSQICSNCGEQFCYFCIWKRTSGASNKCIANGCNKKYKGGNLNALT